MSVANFPLSGSATDQFKPVMIAFEQLWSSVEVGASLAVFHHGEQVVNLWGGFQDRSYQHVWQENTLVNLYSSGKGVVCLAIALLLQDGRLDENKPVSEYWTEFGKAGKNDLTVKQLLSHQAGLPGFATPVSVDDLYNWEFITDILTHQEPHPEAIGQFAYHAITWGFLAGELVRQITGQTPGQFISEQITTPINADLYLGVSNTSLCADMIGPNHARKPLQAKSGRTAQIVSKDPIITPFKHASSEAWRRAEIPASNIHASATGLASCYNSWLDKSFISAVTLQRMTTEVTQGEEDLMLRQPVRRGLGVILSCGQCYLGPNENAFGHSGTGGSIGFADPDANLAVAYVMNQMHMDGGVRSRALIDTIYSCLE